MKTLSPSTHAFIFDRISSRPAYHLQADYPQGWSEKSPDAESSLGFQQASTVCGLATWRYEWEEDPFSTDRTPGRETIKAVSVRLDQAQLFGRPCKRCFEGVA